MLFRVRHGSLQIPIHALTPPIQGARHGSGYDAHNSGCERIRCVYMDTRLNNISAPATPYKRIRTHTISQGRATLTSRALGVFFSLSYPLDSPLRVLTSRRPLGCSSSSSSCRPRCTGSAYVSTNLNGPSGPWPGPSKTHDVGVRHHNRSIYI